MRRAIPAFAALCLALLLSACASGPPTRVFPPQLSLQELSAQADGRWLLRLRIRNLSSVATRYSAVDLRLELAGREAARLQFDPALEVGTQTAEVVDRTISLDAETVAALRAAETARRALPYALAGRVEASQPRGRFEIDYDSALNPVPGREGVWR
jgi:hypothetical protein